MLSAFARRALCRPVQQKFMTICLVLYRIWNLEWRRHLLCF